MNNQKPMTMLELQLAVPSAFAVEPHESRSSRYTYIPTVRIIEGMMKHGFLPFAASQSRSKDESRREYTKHMIRFSHPDQKLAMDGEERVDVVLVNSHDGTSAYKLMEGIFRMVCSNGLIVAKGETNFVSIQHSGNIIDGVIRASQQIIETAPKRLKAVREWKEIELNEDERRVFSESAFMVRFPDDVEREGEGIPKTYAPHQLLNRRRSEDSANDLWTVFNVIQENAVRGGLTGRTASHNVNTGNGQRWQRGRRVSTRDIKGIDQNLKLNQALWALGDKMAALKQQA